MTHRARGTAALNRELFNELTAGPVDADELARNAAHAPAVQPLLAAFSALGLIAFQLTEKMRDLPMDKVGASEPSFAEVVCFSKKAHARSHN
jgi:hypothetical protein